MKPYEFLGLHGKESCGVGSIKVYFYGEDLWFSLGEMKINTKAPDRRIVISGPRLKLGTSVTGSESSLYFISGSELNVQCGYRRVWKWNGPCYSTKTTEKKLKSLDSLWITCPTVEHMGLYLIYFDLDRPAFESRQAYIMFLLSKVSRKAPQSERFLINWSPESLPGSEAAGAWD